MKDDNRTLEVITPAKAVEYLESNKDNRPISQIYVNRYAEDMRMGRWKYNGEAIKFDENGKLIDGQHRLLACIQSNTPFVTDVVRDLEPDCFTTLDNGKGRTCGDALAIMSIPNARLVAAIIKKYLLLKDHKTAIATGDQNTPTTTPFIISEYDARKDFWQDIANFTTRSYANCKAFNKSEIGGIYGYLVLQKMYSAEEAQDFFEQLTDMKATNYDCIRKCRQIFVNDKSRATHIVGSIRQALITKAWNYFVRKKDVQHFAYFNDYDKNIWFN